MVPYQRKKYKSLILCAWCVLVNALFSGPVFRLPRRVSIDCWIGHKTVFAKVHI